MLEKSAWSACPQSSDRGAWVLGKKPNLTALFNTDCSRCLSEASMNPHQRGDAYSILLISVAWVTSHRALPLRPFDLKTLRVKNVWAQRLTKQSMYGLNESWFWTVTPSTTIWSTLCIPGNGGGGMLAFRDLGLRMIISVDFLVFSVRLLSWDQLSIAWSSFWMVCYCIGASKGPDQILRIQHGPAQYCVEKY